ncbi:MAG: GntR family transcriptional regulator [Rhizobiales bacterium]|nr:GntR family transcriptional regulator [Hyphomicrobiales bacterium]
MPHTALLGNRIRDILVARIVSGHYEPGERLLELKLAAEFGTSQVPVREALRDLEMSGLVTIKPRRGSFVNAYESSAQKDIFFVRGALEEAAARIATPRLCGNIAPLQAHVDGMREAARRGDIEALGFHSVAFHRMIVAAADSQLLLKLWESLHVETHTRITLLGRSIDFMAVAESHQPIVDAIRAGDVEAACRLSREHQAYIEHARDDSAVN